MGFADRRLMAFIPGNQGLHALDAVTLELMFDELASYDDEALTKEIALIKKYKRKLVLSFFILPFSFLYALIFYNASPTEWWETLKEDWQYVRSPMKELTRSVLL